MRVGIVMSATASAICLLATPILFTTFFVLPEGKGLSYGGAGMLSLLAGTLYGLVAGLCLEDPRSPSAVILGGFSAAGLFVAALVVFTIGALQPAGEGGAYIVIGIVCLIGAGAFSVGSVFTFAEINDAAKAATVISPSPVAPVIAPQPSTPAVTPPSPQLPAPSPPPPPPEFAKPKEEPPRPFRQRDDRIRELVEASRSKETPLEPMIVVAQLQDIEDDYRRQLNEETKA